MNALAKLRPPNRQLLLLTLIGTFALAIGCYPTPDAKRTPPDRTTKVGRTVRHFLDPARRNWDDTGPRPLTTVVWYPASADSIEQEWLIGPPEREVFSAGWSALDAPMSDDTDTLPLVLLSHGTGGSAIQLGWLAEHLASNGFIAAATNHHGNTAAEDTLMPQGFILWWERSADLSSVLDQLLADPDLGPRIDTSRLAAAGFSLGGCTVLSIAGARFDIEAYEAFCASPAADMTCKSPPEFPEAVERFEEIRNRNARIQESLERHANSFQDERIRSVFAIAPALGMALSEESLREIDIPVRITVGEIDPLASVETNAARVAELIPESRLEVLPGVDHYVFLAECTHRGKRFLEICHDPAGIDRIGIHDQVARDATSFLKATLSVE